MGCQTAIAKDIIKHEADYILAVKDNQKNLHKEVQEMFTVVKSNKGNLAVGKV